MLKPLLVMWIAVLGGVGLAAQSGSVTYYGVTCGPQPPAGMPRIGVGGSPQIGQALAVWQREVQVQKFPDCTHAGRQWVVIGSSRTNGWLGPLPFLLPTGLTLGHQCNVWTSGELIMPFVSISEPTYVVIPHDPAFVGLRFYMQLFILYYNFGAGCYPTLYMRWMTSTCAEVLVGR